MNTADNVYISFISHVRASEIKLVYFTFISVIFHVVRAALDVMRRTWQDCLVLSMVWTKLAISQDCLQYRHRITRLDKTVWRFSVADSLDFRQFCSHHLQTCLVRVSNVKSCLYCSLVWCLLWFELHTCHWNDTVCRTVSETCLTMCDSKKYIITWLKLEKNH